MMRVSVGHPPTALPEFETENPVGGEFLQLLFCVLLQLHSLLMGLIALQVVNSEPT